MSSDTEKEAEPAATRKRRPSLRRTLWRVAWLLLLFGALVGIDYWKYPYGAAIQGPLLDRGGNGLWLRYTWYFGEHSGADRRQLARQLPARHIRYAYFHVRFIGKQGRLKFHYAAQARALTAALHRDAPGVKLLAWIYVDHDGKSASPPLADRNIRQTMVAEALWLVQQCGFDGVQWDVEPCADGDPDFLALMRETRAALPLGAPLSTATPMWAPAALQATGWSESYFAQVAATCDQVVVMGYDSGYYLPRAYVWLMRQQAIHVTHAVGRPGARCRVLIGVPTYGDGLRSHNPHAENLTMALRGVREGLSSPYADPSIFEGIAPFAEYTTSPQDWQTYETLWLNLHHPLR